ncbi:hypothetical protein ACFY7Z_29795 [Streptomyces sp. NPDC012623]|uniref:hypothetical protein n=1 Tax=unclassified Streptomyces TaxID=2593676 RepID=UPI0036C4F510
MCTSSSPRRPEVTEQHGCFHAGATSAVADSAGGYAALALFSENIEALAVDTGSAASRAAPAPPPAP